MIDRLGLELDAHAVRGVRVSGWRRRLLRVAETSWDPDNPAPAVQALRQLLGTGRCVRLAVRLPLLFAKRVKLPPVAPDARRRVLRLAPHRFFPVERDDVVVAVGQGDFVFATGEPRLAAWTRAFSELGPVDLVQPGPTSLAHALGEAGVRDATAVLDDAERGIGLVVVRGGVVERARRIYGSLIDAAPAVAEESGGLGTLYLTPWDEARAAALTSALRGRAVGPLPSVRGVAPPYLSAYGVTADSVQDLSATLLPPALSEHLARRRHRKLAMAALACLASAAFSVQSLDARRADALRAIDSRLRTLGTRAAPVLAVRSDLETLRRRSDVLGRIETQRPDPLQVLLALSTRLPGNAQIRSLELAGGDWQVEGYASQAAEVTQALAADPGFHDLRVLSANNRARMGDHTYESFSIAFRFVSAP
jgi:hypothetical protein